MQYCSLQHRILLLSPVTSTTGCCFCFVSISSFFPELSLHWSPVVYWAPTNLGSSCFSLLSFCCSYCSWGSQGRNTEVVCHSIMDKWLPWWLREVRHLPTMQETGFNPWVRKISWRRKWQPTPVFLPGKSHGQRHLVGYSPWKTNKDSVVMQIRLFWIAFHPAGIAHTQLLLQVMQLNVVWKLYLCLSQNVYFL